MKIFSTKNFKECDTEYNGFSKPSVPQVFAFCSFNYFRNKLTMYTKELLFLRESVKKNKDQLNLE